MKSLRHRNWRTRYSLCLPAGLWSERNAKHSLFRIEVGGVFLREIAKRLDYWAGEANSQPTEADEPHLQEPALRPCHHGIDRTAVPPIGVLLQDCQRVDIPSARPSTIRMGTSWFKRVKHTWENGRCGFLRCKRGKLRARPQNWKLMLIGSFTPTTL